MESVVNNPSYLWLLQFGSWSISWVCLYFILSTLLLVYGTAETWRKNNNERKEVEKQEKLTKEGYWTDDEETVDGHSEFLWTPHDDDDDKLLQDSRKVDRLSCYHKTIWFFQNIAQNSILVVILCCVILDDHVDPMVLASYIAFSVFLLADAIFCFAPIRLTHVVYAYLFTLLYVLVVVVYYVADDNRETSKLPRFVNRIQDRLSSTVVFLILIIGQPLFQTLHFCVHKLNTLVYIKYYGY